MKQQPNTKRCISALCLLPLFSCMLAAALSLAPSAALADNSYGESEAFAIDNRYASGDLNQDDRVDADDLDIFEACATGPGIPYNPSLLPALSPGCTLTPDGSGYIAADSNQDSDVDSDDFAVFQACWSGASQADPSTYLPMAIIPAGEFQMGDTFAEGASTERPVHAIYVDAFFVDRTEVTNQQYVDALNWANNEGNLITMTAGVVYKHDSGTSYPYCHTTTSSPYSRITWNGSTFGVVSGMGNHPVVRVSWYGAVAYANWRSAIKGKPLGYDLSTWSCNFNSGYRLPTEAEWEKAARGGAAGHRFPWSDSDFIQHDRANYYISADNPGPYDNSPTHGYHPSFSVYPHTNPVEYFAANGYGLYGMAGNALEWCNDWHDDSYYSTSPYSNPHGPTSGSDRVCRGGGWSGVAYSCRVANRNHLPPSYFQVSDSGFRLALDAE